MSVPRLIEYMESIKSPSIRGTYIAEHGGGQVIVPVFPPGLLVTQVITPPVGVYALISYRADFGHEMVPNAFSGYYQHRGYRRYDGVLTATVIDIGLEWFLVITNEYPLILSITNDSPLNQYFEGVHQFAAVYTLSDFEFIEGLLNDLANRGQGEMQTEALKLLREMAGVRPAAPYPPIGGV